MRAVSFAPRVSVSARSASSYGLLLGALVLAGGLVRFSTLGVQSLWLDEAFTHAIVSHGLGHVFSSVLFSNHGETEATPPLYYVLLWAWTRVLGTHDVALRAFSAACGTLTIPLMAALGRRLISERIGLLAALLTAANPVLVWYSQEARSYALLVLLSALSLWTLLWALQQPSRRRLAGWGLVCAASLATHYFAIFVIAPEAVWLLGQVRPRGSMTRDQLMIGALAPVITAAALVPLVIHQTPQANWIIQTPLGSRLVLFVVQDVTGYGSSKSLALLGLLLVGLCVTLMLRYGDARERAAIRLPVLVGGLGLAMPVMAALLGFDYFDTRNVLVIWPALGLLVAAGVGVAARRGLGALTAAALVAVGVVCIVNVVGNVGLQRPDWRDAATALGSGTVSRAIVSYNVAGASLAPYTPNLIAYPSAGARVAEIDVVSPLQTKWLGTRAQPLRAATPPPGFAPAQRTQTGTYVIIRYRSKALRYLDLSSLRRLYPGLPKPAVLLRAPIRAH